MHSPGQDRRSRFDSAEYRLLEWSAKNTDKDELKNDGFNMRNENKKCNNYRKFQGRSGSGLCSFFKTLRPVQILLIDHQDRFEPGVQETLLHLIQGQETVGFYNSVQGRMKRVQLTA